MDSRNIFIKAKFHLVNVTWIYPENGDGSSEWRYVGLGDEIRKNDLLLQIIDFFGEEDDLYLVRGRRNSGQLASPEVADSILSLIGEDFIICDLHFWKFMHFYKVGVMRMGERKGA